MFPFELVLKGITLVCKQFYKQIAKLSELGYLQSGINVNWWNLCIVYLIDLVNVKIRILELLLFCCYGDCRLFSDLPD